MRTMEYGRKDYSEYYARAHHARSMAFRAAGRWIWRTLARLLPDRAGEKPDARSQAMPR